jgi:hypothetical protein
MYIKLVPTVVKYLYLSPRHKMCPVRLVVERVEEVELRHPTKNRIWVSTDKINTSYNRIKIHTSNEYPNY